MAIVIEYNENNSCEIKNLFRSRERTIKFVECIIESSKYKFIEIDPDHWFRSETKTHIKVEP